MTKEQIEINVHLPRYLNVDVPRGFCVVIDCDEDDPLNPPMVRLYKREHNSLSEELNRMLIEDPTRNQN